VRRAARALILALVLATPGCARLLRQYDVAPNGLPRADARIRDWLSHGRADSTLARLTRGDAGPGDELLRALFAGTAAHYAGDWSAAAAQLERAAELSEERATKSVSRAALSLITNDLILPYEPSRTERLFIPYFGALTRLRAGDVSGAAVEARRLSALLERFEADGWSAAPGLRATLRYVAGAIFEAAGEANDAAVAYRNAGALAQDLVSPADTAFLAADAGSAPTHVDSAGSRGDIVVIVEHGYVAHRAAEALWVLLAPHELHAFGDGRDEDRGHLASLVADRVLRGEPPPPPRRRTDCAGENGECGATVAKATDQPAEHDRKHHNDDDDPFLLKVAWPVMRRSIDAGAPAQVMLGDATTPARDLGDVSAAVVADFEAERTLILARTIARAALKTALAHAAETKAEEKDEDAGRIIGLLANAGSVLLEQADTRSWHLLPARLSIARIRLPAGPQQVTVEMDGRRIEVMDVSVPAGGIAIVAVRHWR
jgi:hypothetical protein